MYTRKKKFPFALRLRAPHFHFLFPQHKRRCIASLAASRDSCCDGLLKLRIARPKFLLGLFTVAKSVFMIGISLHELKIQ